MAGTDPQYTAFDLSAQAFDPSQTSMHYYGPRDPSTDTEQSSDAYDDRSLIAGQAFCGNVGVLGGRNDQLRGFSSRPAYADFTSSTRERLRQPTPQHQDRGVKISTMADNGFASHDMAAQQEAARHWEPDAEGPLLGEKSSSTLITEEYARADPSYVTKTSVLPSTYPLFRRTRGDGNCGWRAIAFGYLETLIRQGNEQKVATELARLEGFNSILLAGVSGLNPMIFEGFTDETFDLLREIQASLSTPDAALSNLEAKFNDFGTSMNIIYHVRLLASAWLKANLEQYGAFCGDLPVDEYCSTRIDPAAVEIEGLGIRLLSDVLLKPADMVLEIVYLDRSPGSQANVHRFPHDADLERLDSTITLLYRPDHYDILYHPEPVNVQVHRAAISPYQQTHGVLSQGHFSNFRADVIEMLAPSMSPMDYSQPFASPYGGFTGLTLAQPTSWLPQPVTPPSYHSMSPSQPVTEAAAYTSPPATQPRAPLRVTTANRTIPGFHKVDPIRFVQEHSAYNRYAASQEQAAPCVTKPFLNSPQNPQHYSSPNFQPEEYKPELDTKPRYERTLHTKGARKHVKKEH